MTWLGAIVQSRVNMTVGIFLRTSAILCPEKELSGKSENWPMYPRDVCEAIDLDGFDSYSPIRTEIRNLRAKKPLKYQISFESD